MLCKVYTENAIQVKISSDHLQSKLLKQHFSKNIRSDQICCINIPLNCYILMFLLLISFIGRKNSVPDFWFNLLLSYKWRMLRTNLNLFSCQFDLIWRKKRRDQTFWRVKDLNWWENTWIECRGVAFMEKWFDRYIMYTIFF